MYTPEYTSGQARYFSFLAALSALSCSASLSPSRRFCSQRHKAAYGLATLVTILHLAADADADADAGQPVGDINGAQWMSPTSTALVNHRQQKGRSMSGLFR
ncbi:hypothetical protein [Aeromonas dhakensis]|uniref:hypothetical protein n=1 Tax=Aeromonas dhakensis TaxID=196024 RepID=UPI0029D86319|nr:hypothetical protein [Aeromonas dhakensis]MDX7830698.1 hypothetical protein [Aeromonas dhakensis]